MVALASRATHTESFERLRVLLEEIGTGKRGKPPASIVILSDRGVDAEPGVAEREGRVLAALSRASESR